MTIAAPAAQRQYCASVGNMVHRKMSPDAFPLLVREPAFDILTFGILEEV
jgi:hypothetical protein